MQYTEPTLEDYAHIATHTPIALMLPATGPVRVVPYTDALMTSHGHNASKLGDIIDEFGDTVTIHPLFSDPGAGAPNGHLHALRAGDAYLVGSFQPANGGPVHNGVALFMDEISDALQKCDAYRALYFYSKSLTMQWYKDICTHVRTTHTTELHTDNPEAQARFLERFEDLLRTFEHEHAEAWRDKGLILKSNPALKMWATAIEQIMRDELSPELCTEACLEATFAEIIALDDHVPWGADRSIREMAEIKAKLWMRMQKRHLGLAGDVSDPVGRTLQKWSLRAIAFLPFGMLRQGATFSSLVGRILQDWKDDWKAEHGFDLKCVHLLYDPEQAENLTAADLPRLVQIKPDDTLQSLGIQVGHLLLIADDGFRERYNRAQIAPPESTIGEVAAPTEAPLEEPVSTVESEHGAAPVPTVESEHGAAPVPTLSWFTWKGQKMIHTDGRACRHRANRPLGTFLDSLQTTDTPFAFFDPKQIFDPKQMLREQ